jgi:hypothetical protein
LTVHSTPIFIFFRPQRTPSIPLLLQSYLFGTALGCARPQQCVADDQSPLVSTTSSTILCNENSDLNTPKQGGRRRVSRIVVFGRSYRKTCAVPASPPLGTAFVNNTEVVGIILPIFSRLVVCCNEEGNDDTCMPTCRQLTLNATQDYASNRSKTNNQPPSPSPRLQHALCALSLCPSQQHRQGCSVRIVLCQQHLARVFNVLLYSHYAFPRQQYQQNVQRATNASHAPRNVTASRPSNIRWSYVSATTIIGLITTCPSTTTGRSLVACIPVISNFPPFRLVPGVPLRQNAVTHQAQPTEVGL